MEFDLETEKKSFDIHSHGIDFALALWDLDQELRSQIKYDNKYSHDALEYVRDKMRDIMDGYNINFDMIE